MSVLQTVKKGLCELICKRLYSVKAVEPFLVAIVISSFISAVSLVYLLF